MLPRFRKLILGLKRPQFACDHAKRTHIPRLKGYIYYRITGKLYVPDIGWEVPNQLFPEISNSEIKQYLSEIRTSEMILQGHHQLSDFDLQPVPLPRCVGLYIITRHYKPRNIVETGVFHGYSSLYLLEALARNGEGHLYSLDLHPHEIGWFPPLPDRFEPGWIVPGDLRHRWTIRITEITHALESLLKEIEDVDLFYHDSNHSYSHKMFEFKTVLQYMNEGLLCSHDIENDGKEGLQLAFDEISNDLCSKYRSHRNFTAYDGGEPVFGYINID